MPASACQAVRRASPHLVRLERRARRCLVPGHLLLDLGPVLVADGGQRAERRLHVRAGRQDMEASRSCQRVCWPQDPRPCMLPRSGFAGLHRAPMREAYAGAWTTDMLRHMHYAGQHSAGASFRERSAVRVTQYLYEVLGRHLRVQQLLGVGLGQVHGPAAQSTHGRRRRRLACGVASKHAQCRIAMQNACIVSC